MSQIKGSLEVIGKPWFTSDSHFGHTNIIRYTDRPFKNVTHMDEMMIREWNNQITTDQCVIHLGDFSFDPERYVKRVNGKIILVMGNHDNIKNVGLFFNVVQNLSVKVGKFNCFLTHRPLVVEEKRRKDPEPNMSMLDYHDFIICGHVHEKWKVREHKNINVGIDAWGGKIIHYNELLSFLQRVHDEKIDNMESERWA